MLVQAQIATDGTLGSAQNLQGPDYQIDASLGSQRGSNLFHSFQDFNLRFGESATFSGPYSIQNVISRVTGGNPSLIDGTIRSLIPNADFYFLNPFGIVFGPNARLDVQGSFHASTADYLSFSNGGRFYARNPNESILTIAPIEAFGFLDSPAQISVNGSELSVGSGKTFSLIGGNITIKNGTSLPSISAPSGRVNLVSVASQGGVRLEKNFVNVSSFTRLANIYIENSLIQSNTTDVDGIGINVTAEQLTLDDGRLVADTYGDGYGGDIKIKTTGLVELRGESLSPNEQSFNQRELISTSTYGSGNGGDIQIQTEQLHVTDGKYIDSFSFGSGNGGDIQIGVAESLTISGNSPQEISVIGTQAIDSGNAGNVVIQATDIFLENFALIASYTLGSGSSGNIALKTEQLSLTNGARIGTSTFGPGHTRDINIAARFLNLSGSSAIVTTSQPLYDDYKEPLGEVGDVNLNVESLKLEDDSFISLEGTSGGNISITSSGVYLTDSKISTEVFKGGDITIKSGPITLYNSEIKTSGSIIYIIIEDDTDDKELELESALFKTITPLNAEDKLFGNQCANMTRDELSSFQIIIRDVFPESPLNLKTHFLFD